MSVQCRHCAFLRARGPLSPAWDLSEWRCWFGLTLLAEPHDCPSFEREPGADDDLEAANG